MFFVRLWTQSLSCPSLQGTFHSLQTSLFIQTVTKSLILWICSCYLDACESRSRNMLYQNSSVSAHTRKFHALNPGQIIVQNEQVHLSHLLRLPSFLAIFTYPLHWCMHKTFAPYYSWKMLRIQTPFHHDNLSWNQCWVGFRNCTKPPLVIRWFVGAHNCGSQKSKNWFWYLGKPWISII